MPGRNWLLGLLLLCLVILAYQPVWKAGFIWNDDIQVTQNPLVTGRDGWSRIWLPQDLSGPYLPLVYTSFRLEHSLWGSNSTGYHWVNLALHGANALLVWLLLRRLRVPGAWLGAALFALHPVQVETVAWVSQRKSVLALLFCLLSTLGWLRFLDEANAKLKRWLFYGLALACLLLALQSNPAVCTWPIVLLLVLWLGQRPIGWRTLLQTSPFVLLGLAAGLAAVFLERQQAGLTANMAGPAPLEKLLLASRALCFYLGKLFFPLDLSFSYPRWSIRLADPLAWAWVLMLAVLCAAIWVGRKRFARGPEVALAFFVVTLVPLLGFVMLPGFRYSYVADHFQYVACIGPLTLAAAGIALGLKRQKAAPVLQSIIAGSLVVLLGLLTWQASQPYKDPEALWTRTIEKNPGSLLARRSYGRMLLRSGRFDEAVIQCRTAVSMDPRDVDCLLDLGSALYGLGRQDEAAEAYTAALKVNPDSPEAHANLGVILAKQGKTDESIQHRRRAVELDPKLVTVRVNLAAALAAKGEFSDAVQHYDAALKLNPDLPMARINMAIALAVLGRVEEAAEHYDKAAITVATQARRLEEQGKVDEAIGQLKEAMRLIPNNARSRYDLAMLYIRQGQPADARPHLNQALLLKPDFPEAKRALDELRDSSK